MISAVSASSLLLYPCQMHNPNLSRKNGQNEGHATKQLASSLKNLRIESQEKI